MKGMPPDSRRSALLDALRGVAILGMITYHIAFDLSLFWGSDIDVEHGAWWFLARATAITFLLVSGMAVAFSEEQSLSLSLKDRWSKRIQRSLLIALCALLVSFATYLLDSETYVRFGILHLLAVSRLILPLTLRLKRWNILLGALIIALFHTVPFVRDTSLLLPFGIVPPAFATVDYFPIVPWIGVLLMGMGSVQLKFIRDFFIHQRSQTLLTAVGRRSLLIYLIHQPIILLTLRLILGKGSF